MTVVLPAGVWNCEVAAVMLLQLFALTVVLHVRTLVRLPSHSHSSSPHPSWWYRQRALGNVPVMPSTRSDSSMPYAS